MRPSVKFAFPHRDCVTDSLRQDHWAGYFTSGKRFGESKLGYVVVSWDETAKRVLAKIQSAKTTALTRLVGSPVPDYVQQYPLLDIDGTRRRRLFRAWAIVALDGACTSVTQPQTPLLQLWCTLTQRSFTWKSLHFVELNDRYPSGSSC